MGGLEPVRIVAAVIFDEAHRVLLVRKRGSDIFIQPGGKREPGEAALETLARELAEELGVTLRTGTAIALGEFSDEAVHETGRRVEAEVFACKAEGTPQAGAEIQALAWVDPAAPPEDILIAPLSRNHILPASLSLSPARRGEDWGEGASAAGASAFARAGEKPPSP